jgi:hypothetical protein
MISFLAKTSNGEQQTHLREAYRMRLQEVANCHSTPYVAAGGTRSVEAGLSETLMDPQFVAVEETPCSSADAPPQPVEEKPSGGDAAQVAGPAPIIGLSTVAARIAQSLTECWSEVLTEMSRRADLDRNELQTALSSIDSLAGNLGDLNGHINSLCKQTELVDRNCHDLAGRVFGAEQRLTECDHGMERFDAELRRTRESQEETRQRVETLTHALEAHTEAIGKLGAAWSRIEAAQQSFEQRFDRQAQAIQSVHIATSAQAERWGQLRQVAARLVELAGGPADNVPTHPAGASSGHISAA